MSKRCDTCRHLLYSNGGYWEPPEEWCGREDEWGQLVDDGEMSELAGDTEDCLLWEEIVPETEEEVCSGDYETLTDEEFFND